MTAHHSESLSSSVESERAVVLIAYVLHLVGSVTALPSLAALVMNYLKRNDADELLGTHHDYMIRTFWWGFFWFLIGTVATLVLVGWLVLGLVWLWYVYRHLLGLIRLANGEAMRR